MHDPMDRLLGNARACHGDEKRDLTAENRGHLCLDRFRQGVTRRRGGRGAIQSSPRSPRLRVGPALVEVDGNFLAAERPRSATPTGLTVDDHFKHEIEILASPKPPTVGVALWRLVRRLRAMDHDGDETRGLSME